MKTMPSTDATTHFVALQDAAQRGEWLNSDEAFEG